ncbi:nucleic-acid-binding protein from transposon X-element [Trichonephila clavipes]|nr:nucleic-acid-binding protein from transposon X-element [Trichonephila clavipes]
MESTLICTQDNSLWHTQKLSKNKRQAIPPLECDRGTAITDTQKANLLADTLKENFTENTYQNRDTDNLINNTVNTFISTNPTTYLNPVLPDEIITYIKKSSSKKAPVLRPILSYGCPVWCYAAKTNINILDVAQNTLIRKIVGACRRNQQHKRKDDDDFEFPPLRKTARKIILEKSDDVIVENQFSILPNVIIKQVSGQLTPPSPNTQNSTEVTNDQQKQGNNPLPLPILMKITKTYREQVDTVKKIFPQLRLKTTGEYIKLYSNTTEQNRIVRQTLKGLGYNFYVITPKNERPIKVVIKGYSKSADPNDIKLDLEKEEFLRERVTQLIGRRSKQKLPVFQVTLPRSMENLKNFNLKTLAHLNITVDGYNGKGITQCFSCNNFHHNAENCFLKPRCLKCSEEHLTKDCPIKQRLETKFCINCQVYGHMANWYGCPCFPQPPKSADKINRNSYTNLYNSFVRPNFSYAQITKKLTNAKTNFNSQNKQQMAPRRPENLLPN